MINFLINRPIAVTMVFLSILVLGIVAINKIPVSLMPDISIPEVTVQVHSPNTSARELENTVIKPLRRQLLQTTHLADIKSETRDEQGTISLRFDYGTDIDYAFIEVNEKIDQAMAGFPRDMERPKAIKASATDIPVFYLNLTLKHLPETRNPEQETRNNKRTETPNLEQGTLNLKNETTRFIELSRFAENVICKRIEQLPEVSLVDMSGMIYSELLIIPDREKLASLGITVTDIEELISSSNAQLGNLLIRDGQYEYNVQVDTETTNIHELKDLLINKEGRLFRLAELAEVLEQPRERKGIVTINGRDAICMAIIQQGDAQMSDLKQSLKELVNAFRSEYPHIDFEISHDQTALLDFVIRNLRQSLLWGMSLAFVVMFFFMKDFRSPFLIGVSVPVALLITILCFHLAGISINIISLSGLILGVGMMIDNSIIVIDNIAQYRERGFTVIQACVKGTVEVFRSLLSSVLTTCAVFIPLIFLSGISGALFFDQAMAVTIGLLISLLVSVTLLPVYYAIFYCKDRELWLDRKLKQANKLNYEGLYESGFRWIMKHQRFSWVIFLTFCAGAVLLADTLPVSQLPQIARNDFEIFIDWNERIHVDENRRRTDELISSFQQHTVQNLTMSGSQQFLLKGEDRSSSETMVYLKTAEADQVEGLQVEITSYLQEKYPDAVFSFKASESIFDLIFSEKEAPLVVSLQKRGDIGEYSNESLKTIHANLTERYPDQHIESIAWKEHLVLAVDMELARLYDISREIIIKSLKGAFNEHQVLTITSGQEFVPVIIGGGSKTISEIIDETFVTSSAGKQYPIRELLSSRLDYDLKSILAGSEGEYYPVEFAVDDEEAGLIMNDVREVLAGNSFFRAAFTGSLFDNRTLIYEMAGVLLISLLLLYFILASQFESLIIPFIVLLEVPIDLAGAFLMLKIFGGGINLMSMIGLVVMGGIIINDSILKIDTILQLRKQGMPLLKALLVAGQRRLKPILMTSLTTVLALLPVLFSEGLGADLQKPLALGVIGGMLIGVFVSLYFIPLCYYYLDKKTHTKLP